MRALRLAPSGKAPGIDLELYSLMNTEVWADLMHHCDEFSLTLLGSSATCITMSVRKLVANNDRRLVTTSPGSIQDVASGSRPIQHASACRSAEAKRLLGASTEELHSSAVIRKLIFADDLLTVVETGVATLFWVGHIHYWSGYCMEV